MPAHSETRRPSSLAMEQQTLIRLWIKTAARMWFSGSLSHTWIQQENITEKELGRAQGFEIKWDGVLLQSEQRSVQRQEHIRILCSTIKTLGNHSSESKDNRTQPSVTQGCWGALPTQRCWSELGPGEPTRATHKVKRGHDNCASSHRPQIPKAHPKGWYFGDTRMVPKSVGYSFWREMPNVLADQIPSVTFSQMFSLLSRSPLYSLHFLCPLGNFHSQSS